MKKPFYNLLPALWLALFALAITPAISAQTETPPEAPKVAPSEPVAPETSAAPAPSTSPEVVTEMPVVVAPVADAASAPTPAEVEAPSEETTPELRELGATPVETEQPATPSKKTRRTRNSSHDGPPLGNHKVTVGATRSDVISIMGSSTVDGEVTGEAVSIMGNTTVNGKADSAISVMGTTTVNGTVKGEIVSVMGDVVLGPNAVVNDIVVVMGTVKRAEGAQVLGDVQEVTSFGNFGDADDFTGLRAWIDQCFNQGRPLGFGENLGWIWMIAVAFTVFYMLLALIFPKGVVRSAEALELRPGATLLTALLTVIMTPVAFVLLAITGVGIVLIPFLILALFLASLFGMASLLAWFGRRVIGPDGMPLLAVLIGSVIVSLLYVFPYLGFILWKLFGILGVGMVIQALIVANKRDKPAAAAYAAGAAASPVAPIPAMPAQSAGFTSAAPTAETVPPPAMAEAVPPVYTSFTPPPAPTSMPVRPPVVLPVISAATLPRVGFWLRIGAAALDAVLVGVICGFIESMFHGFGSGFLFWYALYCVVMWATKGTTIGGIICSLKVVRLDDRPIDWGVAVVRALGGFLSLFAAGLGFIWVAFDDEKQSWHDKIAGTTIVRVPKGTSLL